MVLTPSMVPNSVVTAVTVAATGVSIAIFQMFPTASSRVAMAGSAITVIHFIQSYTVLGMRGLIEVVSVMVGILPFVNSIALRPHRYDWDCLNGIP